MKVSVVMATYNGEKYLSEQMNSIRLQTRKIDEVIFSDDNSSDGTKEIIGNYIKKYSLDGWKIVDGPQKGITKNFYNGVTVATGDIIFFSDQDDIWELEKIEEMMRPFECSNILTVTCRKKLIDASGNFTNEYPDFVVYPFIRKGLGKELKLLVELKYLTGSGLCLAFRKKIFGEVQKIVEKYDLQYDLPFAIISSIKNGNYSLNKKFVLHRIHTSNASSPINSIGGRRGKIQHQILSHSMKKRLLNAVLKEYEKDLSNRETKIISRAIQLHQEYITALKNKNLLKLFYLIIVGNKIINRFLGISDIISAL